MARPDGHASELAGKWGGGNAIFPLPLALLTAIGFDALTKTWAERALAVGDPAPVLGDVFRLTLGYNTGVAFSLFVQGGRSLLVITGAMIIGLVAWLLHRQRAGTVPRGVWSLGLILGGAVANFVDRWPDGRVTDLLDVGIGAARWPTFNLADSFIFVGAALLLAGNLFDRPPSPSPSARKP